jgi:anti-sigma B factor antagonist
MLLQIEERQIEPGVTLVELTGKLALGRESQRLESIAADIAAKGAAKVILDLSKLDYIDSAGIGIIALAAGRVKKAGGKLAVVAAPGRVLDVLKVAGVDALLNITDTVEGAKAAVA